MTADVNSRNITYPLFAHFHTLSAYCRKKIDSVTQKIHSIQTTHFTQTSALAISIRRWGPLAIGGALFTYLFPYFIATVAIISTLAIYYSSDIKALLSIQPNRTEASENEKEF